MIKTIVSARAGGIPGTDNKGASATISCHNLRPAVIDNLQNVLQPVGQPTILLSGNWRPLTELHRSDGLESLIVYDGETLGAYTHSELSPIDTFTSPVKCVLALGNNLTVMTDSGPVEYSLDCCTGQWQKLSTDSLLIFSLIAEEATDCEIRVEARQLAGDYSSATAVLRDSDRRAIDSDVKDAYLRLVAQATADGAYCARVLMRYRVIDINGEVAAVSPPLLLGAADSDRLTRPITVTSTDRRRLDGYRVSARAWHPRLVCEQPIADVVKASISRIELLACPQFHPCDPSEDAAIDLVTAAGSDTMLRVTLPGAGKAVALANSEAARRKIMAMMAAMDKYERVVAVVERPFAAADRPDVTLDCRAAFGTVADECAVIEKICTSRIDAVEREVVELSAPHTFSARCVASAADAVVWGSLSAMRFSGYAPQIFAASRSGTGAWHAAVAVSFASGEEQIVVAAQGDSGAPLTFNPVLSYPVPDATAMTIIVSSGGEVRRVVVPLTPDPSRRHSVYVHPTFTPFAPSETLPLFVVPPVKQVVRSMAGYVAAAGYRRPTDVTAVGYVGNGAVKQLMPSSRSQSSWDFTRPRFVAFSTSGIHSLTLSSSRTALSVNMIDSRRPTAAIYAAGRLLAVAGGSLVEVGASRAKTLLRDVKADFLAFDSNGSELWLSCRGCDKSTVLRLEDLSRYTRDGALAATGVGRYALVGNTLRDLTVEDATEAVDVRWTVALSLGRDYRRVRRLRFDLRSSSIDGGRLSLSRRSLRDLEPANSLQLMINGRVGSPIVTPVISAPMRSATVDFQGTVSPDTLFSSIDLYL